MCLTQQEGSGTHVRNLLISSQIQQQSMNFMQRHRAGMMDDSDSDSESDSDDEDGSAAFAALPDAFKQGAMFGRSQPAHDEAEQSTLPAVNLKAIQLPSAAVSSSRAVAAAASPVVSVLPAIKEMECEAVRAPVQCQAGTPVSKSEHEDDSEDENEEDQAQVTPTVSVPRVVLQDLPKVVLQMEIKTLLSKSSLQTQVPHGSHSFQSLSEMTTFSSMSATHTHTHNFTNTANSNINCEDASVVSEMTNLSAMTAFSAMSTCDTVDTAFFGEDPLLLSDIEDDDDDEEESMFDEAQVQALISIATRQLQSQTQLQPCSIANLNTNMNTTPLTASACHNVKSVLMSHHKTTSAAVTEHHQRAQGHHRSSNGSSVLKELCAADWQRLANAVRAEEEEDCWGPLEDDVNVNANAEKSKSSATISPDSTRPASAVASAVAEAPQVCLPGASGDAPTGTTAKQEEEVKEEAAGTLTATATAPPREEANTNTKNKPRQNQFKLAGHIHRMKTSHESQVELQKWDAKMGLRRCHCKTMMDTSSSRKALLEVMGVFVQDYEPPAAPPKRRARNAAANAIAAASKREREADHHGTIKTTNMKPNKRCGAASAAGVIEIKTTPVTTTTTTSTNAFFKKTIPSSAGKRSLAQPNTTAAAGGGVSKKIKLTIPTLYNPLLA
jgi:hypothetical protein